jgi:hypothetical protein
MVNQFNRMIRDLLAFPRVVLLGLLLSHLTILCSSGCQGMNQPRMNGDEDHGGSSSAGLRDSP